MKRVFNHTKRPWKESRSRQVWEDEYNEDDCGLNGEEGTDGWDGEYYADEAPEDEAEGGEYYADENPEDEGEGEEYYADEALEDEAEGGEYYADENPEDEGEGEEYYADENPEDEGEGEEYYADEAPEDEAEGGEYYADEAPEDEGEGEEYYADEAPEDEGEAGEYYAEEEPGAEGEDGEYYAEEEPDVEVGEYYGDEDTAAVYPQGGEILYEDDDLYNADYRGEQSRADKSGRKKSGSGLLRKLKDMSVMDRAIAVTGVAVLILAVVTGAVLIRSRIVAAQVSDFVSVGTQLENIDVIGGDGLVAVADAQIARLEAAMLKDPEETEPPVEEEEPEPGYEENEYSRQVSVELNMTSIQKDLKIKFTNRKTGKLVANVPFSVTVTDPDGKTSIWSDDDMDGIIHKKDIASGTYKVAMEKLTDERYKDYSVSTTAHTAEVKKDISYEKVDVDNEVKTEAEVDVQQEDTAQKEIVVESALKDTVAWVESTSVGLSYKEVPKSDIVDPLQILTVARGLEKDFLRMTLSSSVTVTVTAAPGQEIQVGETTQLTAAKPTITGDANENITGVEVTGVKWTSQSPEVAAVDSDSGLVTGVKAGEAVIQYTATAKVTVAEPPAVSGGDATEEDTEKTTTSEVPVSGQITVTVVEAPPVLSGGTLTADKTALATVVKGTVTAQVTAKNFAEGEKLVYTVASDKETVATAEIDAEGKVTVTGVAAGAANITVTANYEEGGTDETAAKTVIAVTVGANKTIELSSRTTLAYVANPLTLKAVIKGAVTMQPSVTVESDNTNVMKATVGAFQAENNAITVPITLELIQEGSATLTVKCLENGEEVKTTCVVTVRANPKTDGKTELKDKWGNLLYVMENGAYRQAVYADYYTFDKFYIKGEVKYTGWQTLNGHVYYFTAEGKAVTGEQVIQGAKYTFASDGTLVTGNGALGIDVSKWNKNIDWDAVKNSGISYVIIRCGYRGSSQGALIEDPKFQANIKGATEAGLKVGVYFFTQAVDEREAVEEASMVLGLIRNYRISYPVFLDVESSGGRADTISRETRTAVCKAFCETIQKEGYTAGIYANKTWLENKIDAGALSAYKIWLAQYAEAPTYTGRYDLWQYRSTGKVSGISGDVDMNLSYLGY